MILSSVSLRNFRSHTDTSLVFSSGLNYIVGGNGVGKTSVLEAIYYLCTTKSNSSKTDCDAVNFDENEFEIKGIFKDVTEDKVRVIYSLTENKKSYLINNKNVSRSSEIIGKFPVVMLTPADHSITLGSPSDRRKFVDSIISQASKTYLNILLDYNKTLRQRSSLLSLLKDKRNSLDYKELDAWTEKLISAGTEIINHRIKFIDHFRDFVKESYSKIMGDDELPEIKYNYFDDSGSSTDIESKFRALIEQVREEELRRAVNLVGPHRDDFIFEINGMNLKTFGSQGQNKTFQAVLRFAQFFYLTEITGKTPIFLLDDVFGELDAARSSKISEYLKEVGQAFITITDFANMSFLSRSENDKVIKINKGKAAYA